MARTTWVQSKGIPMTAWLEENIKAYTRELGEWISWSYQKDDSKDLFDPIICISTNRFDLIKEEMIILVRGVQYKIRFEEILEPRDLAGKLSPMQISPSKSHVSLSNSCFQNADL